MKTRDTTEGPQYGLIEQMVTYCLDCGYDVVLEGILHRQRYAPMLERLAQQHRGITVAYYFDVSWQKTLRRHAGRPQAAEFGAEDMAGWYCPRDLLGWGEERFVSETAGLAETVGRLLTELSPEKPLVDPALTSRVACSPHRGA